MKYFLLTLLCLIFLGRVFANASVPVKDSLVRTLSETQGPDEQIRICRNLADLCFSTPDETKYLALLADMAEKAGKTETALEALTDLADAYMNVDSVDSAKRYINEVERLAPRAEKDRWMRYLTMSLFYTEIFLDKEENALEDKLAAYQSKDKSKESIYEQIEDAYVVGAAYFRQSMYDKAVPYLNTAVELAEKLPLKEGMLYKQLTMRLLAKACTASKQNTKAITLLENVIGLKERYGDEYYKASRPYYPMDNFYIINYSSLLVNGRFMPKEKADSYMDRLTGLSAKSNSLRSKYGCFLAMNNYYLSRGDAENALATNDSLIGYAKQMAVYNLPGLYQLSSMLLEHMKRPQEALDILKLSYQLEDSLKNQKTQDQLSELQVQYDVNRLNYEKIQLEVKNKRIMVVFLLVGLALVTAFCLYLYSRFKKERQMKEKMHELKIRAEETERMKTAFINSICHEIRTPLNAIVGFSSLVFDESLDEETRKTFPQEIEQSTEQLTSLINSMLEVANLDVSDEKLPCEPTDIAAICHHGIESLRTRIGIGIECRAELPDTPLILATNPRYLALVVENLLSNAGKFTEKGIIALKCIRKDDKLVIIVTDTGCGIPADMREMVFDRFMKLDGYKPGNGLGLYLCRLIVKRLSGRIYIDPDYSEGTRMVVELPADEAGCS